jgi:hypothetical protein
MNSLGKAPCLSYTSAMPDRGFWTLRCQGCQKDFIIEIQPGERLADFAKSLPCEHCGKKPEEHSTADKATWHYVVGFQAKRK